MKKLLLTVLFSFLFQSSFILLSTPVRVSAQDQEILDNSAVIELVKTDLSEDVIVSMIKNSKTSFDTSVAGVKALNDAGVSDAVILAMVQSGSKMEIEKPSESTTVSITSETPKENTEFRLPDGTPVKLRTGRNLSSADAKTGETIDFEILEDVIVDEVLVIKRGSFALGTVTQAKPKGRMGKAGKLDLTIDSVILVSGEKVALRAVKETKGNGRTGAMTGAIVASSILFFPAAPFFLFMKGKDISIPKGTEVTAYINGDITLDRSKFDKTN